MNNLYVFAIGGSGERVMKSLILTLASGVQADVKQIVPVFVDNDEKSNALMKCLDLIKYYNSDPQKGQQVGANTTYRQISGNPEDWPSFFRTVIAEPIILNKAGGAIGNLDKVIGVIDTKNKLQNNIAEERELLFTDNDLQMPLNVGFVGNPNIGSVVLNSLSLSDTNFKSIVGSISSNDGVIVCGSLFGGTGAAGFPLIINTFNEIATGNKPILGGVAVLPYFALQEKDNTQGIIDTTKWDVNSDSFDTKTRAALMYYDEYMRDMDCLYYVGDGSAKDVYEHYVGGEKQENPTHLVELMAALSIIDFSKQTHSNNVIYKIPVWGTNEAGTDKIPTNFSGIKNSELKIALAKFEMMKQLFEKDAFLKWGIDEKKPYVHNIGFTNAMRTAICDHSQMDKNAYSWGINNLIHEWTKWMQELGRNGAKRQFLIFDEKASITDSNITKYFFTNDDSGIARIAEKKENSWNPFSKTVSTPADAGIAEALLSAYKKLHPNGRAEQAATIEESKKVPLMLQIISVALDDVIKNKCISM